MMENNYWFLSGTRDSFCWKKTSPGPPAYVENLKRSICSNNYVISFYNTVMAFKRRLQVAAIVRLRLVVYCIKARGRPKHTLEKILIFVFVRIATFVCMVFSVRAFNSRLKWLMYDHGMMKTAHRAAREQYLKQPRDLIHNTYSACSAEPILLFLEPKTFPQRRVRFIIIYCAASAKYNNNRFTRFEVPNTKIQTLTFFPRRYCTVCLLIIYGCAACAGCIYFNVYYDLQLTPSHTHAR